MIHKVRIVLTAVLFAGLTLGALGTPAAAEPTPRDATEIAAAELANDERNHEVGGCNFYTGALGRTSPGCPDGWGKVDWCADFGRWVWQQAGLKTDGLDAYAESFKKYGKANNTWHEADGNYQPKPGDAIVYQDQNGNGIADHVGLVVESGPGKLITIEGNYGEKITKRTDPANAQGFTTPVAG